mgnify:CR=1 FL=1
MTPRLMAPGADIERTNTGYALAILMRSGGSMSTHEIASALCEIAFPGSRTDGVEQALERILASQPMVFEQVDGGAEPRRARWRPTREFIAWIAYRRRHPTPTGTRADNDA